MGAEPALGASVARRRVDGVVLLDKPLGITSNAALQRVKRAYRAQKAGHTGTLDPLASGLLPICLGEATKFSQALLDAGKIYRTEFVLGITTETGDTEGRVVHERAVTVERADIDRVLETFRGGIMQVPHRYSAIKRGGRALYDYARSGEEIAVESRSIRIEGLEVESWKTPRLMLRVSCSKGTYIRSLAEDIGEALGCGAHVSLLRRVGIGHFDVSGAIGLASVEADGDANRDAALLPVVALVADLPTVTLEGLEADRFRHGIAAPLGKRHVDQSREVGQLFAVHAPIGAPYDRGVFLGIARIETRDGVEVLVPARLMATTPAQPSGIVLSG